MAKKDPKDPELTAEAKVKIIKTPSTFHKYACPDAIRESVPLGALTRFQYGPLYHSSEASNGEF